MFWVTTPDDLLPRKRLARARCPRPGLAAAKCSCMAKRRRQDSSRAACVAMNSSNGMGAILVQMPPGERKSGIPHSVEIPAPVKGTITFESATRLRSRATAVCRSWAIMVRLLALPEKIPAGYRFAGGLPTDNEVRSGVRPSIPAQRGSLARWSPEISAHRAARAQSERCARLRLQQARPDRGAPARGREEPLHAGLPRRPGGRTAGRRKQAHRARRPAGRAHL